MRQMIRSLFARPSLRNLGRTKKPRLLTSRHRLTLNNLEERSVPAAFVVSSLADSGIGTLRDAIAAANDETLNPGMDTITFSVAGTISLASTLSVQTDLVINNTGGTVTLDGLNANQIMNFFAPATKVDITNLVFTKGKSIGLAGGAIAPAPGTNLALTLTNVTVSKSFSDVGGGGISMDSGSLTLVGCTISGNTALGSLAATNVYGGGIYLTGAATTFSISNSSISGNLVRGVGNVGYGGGMAIKGPTGSFVVSNSTFDANTGDGGQGGAIMNNSAGLTFNNCVFTNNRALNTSTGGVIAHDVAAQPLTFNDCRMINNTANNTGGAIYVPTAGANITIARGYFENNRNVDGSAPAGVLGAYAIAPGIVVDISDSTFIGNVSTNAGGVFSSNSADATSVINFRNSTFINNSSTGRGGVFRVFGTFGATINVENCTATGNSCASTSNGGAFAGGGTATFKLNIVNSIVAENLRGTVLNHEQADIWSNAPAGSVVSINYSLIGVTPTTTAFTVPTPGSNKMGTAAAPLNPQLRPLTNYGGTTKTRAPLPTSPAVNNGTASALANDQRGAPFVRDFGGAVDMGAVEANTPLPWVSAVAAPGVSVVGGTTYEFTITFEDTGAVDNSTLGAPNAIQVRGGAFATPVFATLKSPVAGPGTPLTATYVLTPPGGAWDATDNGTYTISVVGGKIFDTDVTPNAVPADDYGTFTVGVPTVFVVNATNDEAADTDGKLSFREAIQLANASPGADTVTFSGSVFAGSETITFTKTTIAVTESVTIQGPANKVTIDAAKLSHHLNIDGLGVMNVSISGINFINGVRTGAGIGSNGGSIYINNENVTITDCSFSDNSCEIDGGAIGQNGAGDLTITKSTFTNNVTKAGSGFSGGGVFHGGTGKLTIGDSTFTTNKGDAVGGAVRAAGTTTVAITGCVFTSNESNGKDVIGGGALAMSGVTTLTVSSSTFTGNLQTLTGDGGAISLFAGTTAVTISNSTFTNNSTLAGNGGAIVTRNDFTGTVVIDNCTFTGNKADGGGNGGAIRAGGNATITLNRSTFDGNMAVTGLGGVVAMMDGGSLIVNASTLSGNTAGINGGGIYSKGGVGAALLVSNSTLSGNTANNDGGAILISAFTTSTATIRNSTLTLNNATAGFIGGGGIAIQGTTGTVTISSCIIAQNLSGGDAKDVGADGATTITGKNNVIGVGDKGNITYDPANQVGTLALPLDAKLAPLALNGAPAGSPLTHAITTASPAYNMGNDTASLGTDQRGVGFSRVSGGFADAGAFEIQFAVPPTVVSVLTNGVASGQHSKVTSIVINFSEVVTIANPSLAFVINRYAGATAGDSPATGTVGYSVSGLDAMNKGQSVTITFNGTGVVGIDPGNSLRDGKYQVTIVAAQVAGTGGNLDGNANGKHDPGDPNMDNNLSTTWRLFGDGNGDGAVNSLDFALFRGVFGTSAPGSAFDFNNDGLVNTTDFAQFRGRFGLSGYNVP